LPLFRVKHGQHSHLELTSGELEMYLALHDLFSRQYIHSSCVFTNALVRAIILYGNIGFRRHQFLNYSASANPNQWLTESFTELAVLWMLNQLPSWWKKELPFEYLASNLPIQTKQYLKNYLQHQSKELGSDVEFASKSSSLSWFTEAEPELRKFTSNSGAFWARVTIVAMRLLSLVDSYTNIWASLVYLLPSEAPPQDETLSQHLKGWLERAPLEFHSLIRDVAGVFGLIL